MEKNAALSCSAACAIVAVIAVALTTLVDGPVKVLVINPVPIGQWRNSGVCTDRLAAEVIKLHIQQDFFTYLKAGQSICPTPTAGGSSCLATSVSTATGGDNGSETPMSPDHPPQNVGENWGTPLDFTIPKSYWHHNDPKVEDRPILLEIILDDKSMQFLHAVTAAPLDSTLALQQGAQSELMFDCLEKVQTTSDNKQFLKVRIINNGEQISGLNIGVLVPVGGKMADGSQILMPIYIDPKDHNSG